MHLRLRSAGPSTEPLELDLSVGYGVPRRGVPAPASFRRWVQAALETRLHRADLAIRVVGEKEGCALNRHYRGKDYATNVLSFPAELPQGVQLPVLGDIVLCAPVIEREAREQGKLPPAHWAHMTVHGVLHLLGLDHADPVEAEAMENLERQILAALHIADPYLE